MVKLIKKETNKQTKKPTEVKIPFFLTRMVCQISTVQDTYCVQGT